MKSLSKQEGEHTTILRVAGKRNYTSVLTLAIPEGFKSQVLWGPWDQISWYPWIMKWILGTVDAGILATQSSVPTLG